MKRKNDNLVEMVVMTRNDKEVAYYCPKCKDIAKISVEENLQEIEDRYKQDAEVEKNASNEEQEAEMPVTEENTESEVSE